MPQGTYLFVLPIRAISIGRTYNKLPLHCTLIHWFNTEATPVRLSTLAQNILTGIGRIPITASDKAFFGHNQDIPVSVVVPHKKLMNVHQQLFQALLTVPVSFTEPQWVGEGYRPHVTFQGSNGLPVNKTVHASSVVLVEAQFNDAENRSRYIHREIPL